MDNIQWHVEKRRVSDLKPYHKNPRIITESGLRELGESFEEIGNAQPININLDNVILSGHARWKHLSEKDENAEVLVLVPNRALTEKEEEAVIVRMNKNIAGVWDFDVLANEFELNDLVDWGFNEKELKIEVMPTLDDVNSEIDLDNFGNDLQHTCPKCGFEFNG